AQGVVTSPVVADLSGNGTKQIALGVFLGDATIYNADGTTMQTLQGTFGATGAGSDMDETTPEGGLPRSSDSPGHFYVAQGAFADIHGLGQLDYLAGEVGNGIVGSAAGSGPPVLFDHLLSAWNATTGAVEPAFPLVIEDWQFFNGPAVAEISGDTLPEIIDSSGGYFVPAFNAAGLEPAGSPKLTGHRQPAAPSIGHLDDSAHAHAVPPALRAADEVGNAGPIAVVAQARPFTLRRLRLVVAGPGRDRLVLRGAMAQTLAQLGLPGQSVAIALSDAGGEYFRATIPAAQILASPRGTLVRFRDRTGTIANGITSFTMGGGGS